MPPASPHWQISQKTWITIAKLYALSFSGQLALCPMALLQRTKPFLLSMLSQSEVRVGGGSWGSGASLNWENNWFWSMGRWGKFVGFRVVRSTVCIVVVLHGHSLFYMLPCKKKTPDTQWGSIPGYTNIFYWCEDAFARKTNHYVLLCTLQECFLLTSTITSSSSAPFSGLKSGLRLSQ